MRHRGKKASYIYGVRLGSSYPHFFLDIVILAHKDFDSTEKQGHAGRPSLNQRKGQKFSHYYQCTGLCLLVSPLSSSTLPTAELVHDPEE